MDISKAKYVSLISGLLFLISGIYMIYNPLFIAYTMNIIFCILLIIEGVSQISAYIYEKHESRSIWRLIEGIISIVIGIYFLIGDSLGLPLAFITVIGIWLIIIGISRLLMARRVMEFERNIAKRLIVAGILEIIFGIIAVARPVAISNYIAYLIAIALIVQAIVDIFRFFRLNRMQRKMK